MTSGAMATRSEIRENPSKQGVTVAASGKELEADVQRKMKVWGVIEAFRDGCVQRSHSASVGGSS